MSRSALKSSEDRPANLITYKPNAKILLPGHLIPDDLRSSAWVHLALRVLYGKGTDFYQGWIQNLYIRSKLMFIIWKPHHDL